MRIADLLLKIKSHEHELFHSVLLLGVALGAFGLGYFAGLERGREPVRVTFPESLAVTTTSPTSTLTSESKLPAATEVSSKQSSKQVVLASKQGSKYHFPHCPGAKQIKETNQIWFNSPAEAEAAGYTLAGNCQAK